jgi:hypothetical protein
MRSLPISNKFHVFERIDESPKGNKLKDKRPSKEKLHPFDVTWQPINYALRVLDYGSRFNLPNSLLYRRKTAHVWL